MGDLQYGRQPAIVILIQEFASELPQKWSQASKCFWVGMLLPYLYTHV